MGLSACGDGCCLIKVDTSLRFFSCFNHMFVFELAGGRVRPRACFWMEGMGGERWGV